MIKKADLEVLYVKNNNSIREIAKKLGVSRSTVFYYMKKYDIPARPKKEAQKVYQNKKGHQRKGKRHTNSTKDKISNKLRQYWDSGEGKKVKKKISEARKKYWNDLSLLEKREIIDGMTTADRQREMSKVCQTLYEFLVEKGEEVAYNIEIKNVKCDIVIESLKVAICVIPIFSEGKSYTKELPQQVLDYKILPYKTKNTVISRAECIRIYEIVQNLGIRI